MPEETFETPQPIPPTAEPLARSQSSSRPEVGRPLDDGRNWPKIILAVIFGFALLIAAAYAGYWYGTESVKIRPRADQPLADKSQTSKPTTVAQPTPKPTLTPTPTQDPTTTWKTYTNTKYKYTLKYPQTWYVSSLPGTDLVTFNEPLFSSECDYNKGQLCTNVYVLVATFNPKVGIYEGDIIIDAAEGDRVTNEVSLTLDGEVARGFEYWQENYGESGRLLYLVTAIHKNNKYTIMYEEERKSKEFLSGRDWENKEMLDQILSTFKFLD